VSNDETSIRIEGEPEPKDDWERIDFMKSNVSFGERELIKTSLAKGYKAQNIIFDEDPNATPRRQLFNH
jgi:hypothetical protein